MLKTGRFDLGEDFGQFVNLQDGWIDRHIFSDEQIYQEELHRIFARSWNFVAHESQLAKPGDFLTTYMGEDPVIVARQRDQSIKVFVNSCPHRGNRVCFADAGNTRRFVCNYHGWAFDTAGKLSGMHAEYAYTDDDIDRPETSLQPVAKVASYKGLVFATFDRDTPSLDDWLGDYRWYLDMLLDNEEGGTEFIGGCIKSVFEANWKFGVENFIGDAYHAGWTHDSGVRATTGGEPFPDIDMQNSFHGSANGHGWEFGLDEMANIMLLGSPAVMEYYNEMWPRMSARLGEIRSKVFGSVASASIFPNISFLPGLGTFRVWLPKGPMKFELRTWVIVNKAMPEHIKQEITKRVMLTFGPGGLFEMDDGENWQNCTTVNRGVVTRRQLLHYRSGLSRRIDDHPTFPGTVYRGQYNDANQRLFYERWVDMMETKNIQDLPVREKPRMAGRETRELVDVSAV